VQVTGDVLQLTRLDGSSRTLASDLAHNDFDALAAWARSASSKE
jgi:hypothetical protein